MAWRSMRDGNPSSTLQQSDRCFSTGSPTLPSVTLRQSKAFQPLLCVCVRTSVAPQSEKTQKISNCKTARALSTHSQLSHTHTHGLVAVPLFRTPHRSLFFPLPSPLVTFPQLEHTRNPYITIIPGCGLISQPRHIAERTNDHSIVPTHIPFRMYATRSSASTAITTGRSERTHSIS